MPSTHSEGLLRGKKKEGSPLSQKIKIQMVLHTALGMEHLTTNHFIHRDLAARNVLVATGMIGQVADFGLSRLAKVGVAGDKDDHEDDSDGQGDYYRSKAGIFPVRWTAPEAMEELKFSSASDIWSFGITVIEVFTDGETPYHGTDNAAVMNKVMAGHIHPPPSTIPADLYNALKGCWAQKASDRNSFSHMISIIEPMHRAANGTTKEAWSQAKLRTVGSVSDLEASNIYNQFGFDEDAGPEAVGEGFITVEPTDGVANANTNPDRNASVGSIGNPLAYTTNSSHNGVVAGENQTAQDVLADATNNAVADGNGDGDGDGDADVGEKKYVSRVLSAASFNAEQSLYVQPSKASTAVRNNLSRAAVTGEPPAISPREQSIVQAQQEPGKTGGHDIYIESDGAEGNEGRRSFTRVDSQTLNNVYIQAGPSRPSQVDDEYIETIGAATAYASTHDAIEGEPEGSVVFPEHPTDGDDGVRALRAQITDWEEEGLDVGEGPNGTMSATSNHYYPPKSNFEEDNL